jgi:hypothetical protein
LAVLVAVDVDVGADVPVAPGVPEAVADDGAVAAPLRSAVADAAVATDEPEPGMTRNSVSTRPTRHRPALLLNALSITRFSI